MKIKFIIPGEPQGKARPRVVRMKSGRSMSYTPDKTVAYEELVRQRFLAEAQGRRFADATPIDIIITAFLGIPKSASKRKQMLMTSGALFPMKEPDLDNVMKIVCDALNGIAYKDDAQIVNAKICKRWSSEMPSVWVTICGTEREGENDERKEV